MRGTNHIKANKAIEALLRVLGEKFNTSQNQVLIYISGKVDHAKFILGDLLYLQAVCYPFLRAFERISELDNDRELLFK